MFTHLANQVLPSALQKGWGFRLEDLYETILLEARADRITPLATNPGRLMLTSSRLYFQPFNNIDKVGLAPSICIIIRMLVLAVGCPSVCLSVYMCFSCCFCVIVGVSVLCI